MKNKIIVIGVILLVFLLGGGVGYLVSKSWKSENIKKEENKYSAFISEVYLVIKENYWNKLEDEQLNKLFVLGTEKLTGQSQSGKFETKADLDSMLEKIVNDYDSDEKRKEFVVTLSDVVLSNLEPFGRSRLYTSKDEQALSDNVSNKTDVDQYEVLNVEKKATQEEIKEAYGQEAKKWNPETNKDPQAQQKFEQINKAYKVLSDEGSRNVYDLAGIEPTMDYKQLNTETFYFHWTKFSPTSFDDLKRVLEKTGSNNNLSSLILDLRDNVGGAIDGLPYFLGPFIGNDQYAYQFLSQGKKTDFKTKIGWLPELVKFKKVVILINENSQSTAEVMAATLKKYNVGVVLGKTTKGWGTVERVFQMKKQMDPKEKHSIFLVHSLTLNEEGIPIEGTGVTPVIDITSKSWEKQLYDYYSSNTLVESVKEVL